MEDPAPQQLHLRGAQLVGQTREGVELGAHARLPQQRRRLLPPPVQHQLVRGAVALEQLREGEALPEAVVHSLKHTHTHTPTCSSFNGVGAGLAEVWGLLT